MNIIYADWNCFGGRDILEALSDMEYQIHIIGLSKSARYGQDTEYTDRLVNCIKDKNADLVISFNYYPSISEACMRTGIRYFAWIYDSPYVKVYDRSIVNNVNYIGTFDSFTADELNGKGVTTVHYVPLAVNSKRLERYAAEQYGKEWHEVSFVGSLYNDKNKFYERLYEAGRDMQLIGYLDAVIDAQRQLCSVNILDESLSDDVVTRIGNVMPYKIADGSLTSERRVYADYYLAPRVTFLDRQEIITRLADRHSVDYYTYTDYKLGKAHNRGKVDYYEEMPMVFAYSKINLNISLRSIRTGIPLRAMDIMGVGGFLLTNYQADMFRHFEAGKHFDYYTSVDEAVDKAGYYLSNDSERSRIAAAAYEEMKLRHTYNIRLKEVFGQL